MGTNRSKRQRKRKFAKNLTEGVLEFLVTGFDFSSDHHNPFSTETEHRDTWMEHKDYLIERAKNEAKQNKLGYWYWLDLYLPWGPVQESFHSYWTIEKKSFMEWPRPLTLSELNGKTEDKT